MDDNTPYIASPDEVISPATNSSTGVSQTNLYGRQPMAPASQQAAPTNSADAPYIASHDEIITPAPGAAQPVTQDQQDNQLLKMLNDPNTTGDQIRQLYKDQRIQLPEEANNLLTQRDAYRAANPGKVPQIGVGGDPLQPSSTPTLVDNRPLSWGNGFVDGLEHVGENVVGGVGLAANLNSALGSPFGIQNNWKNDVHNYYQGIQGARQDQGSANGRLAGEITASLPAGLVAAPVAAGAGAVGVPAGAAGLIGLGSAGALQSLLTTHATTPGGIAQDAAVGAGTGAILGKIGDGLHSLITGPADSYISTPAQRILAKIADPLGSPTVNPSPTAVAGRQVLDAADRLSQRGDGLTLNPLPAETGGMIAKGIHGGADSSLFGNTILNSSILDNRTAAAAMRDRAAASYLPDGVQPLSLNDLGDTLKNDAGGLGKYVEETGNPIKQQYNSLDEASAPFSYEAPGVRQATADLIARTEAMKGAKPGLAALKALQDDITPSATQSPRYDFMHAEFGGAPRQVAPQVNSAETTTQGWRDTRTGFGDNFDANQRNVSQNAKQLWGPLSDDIENGLRSHGQDDLADGYRAQDQAWANLKDNEKNIIQPLLGRDGNVSEEMLGQRIARFANKNTGNADLLSKAMSVMDPDMAGHIPASIISNLGRNADGSFSAAKFATDYGNLSDLVKRNVLTGQGGKDISDLASWSGANRDSGVLNGKSGTPRILALMQGANKAIQLPLLALSGHPSATAPAMISNGIGPLMGSMASSSNLARLGVKMGETRPLSRAASALMDVGSVTAPGYNNDPRNSMSDDHH